MSIEEILGYIVAGTIALSSLLATLTPKPKEGSIYYYIYTIIQWLALNFGRAKNEQDRSNKTDISSAFKNDKNGK